MKPTNIHVHLYYGIDPRRFRNGEKPGCIYGYHHARSDALSVTYSHDHPEGRLLSVVRRGLKAVIGFDMIHTFRNRAALAEADVIWTHTEREYLSVALLLMLTRRERQPLLLAQSVWLLDLWKNLSLPKRLFYTWLLRRADMLTTLTTRNAALVKEFWGRKATVVLYGLNTDDFPVRPATEWKPHSPLRVAAIGNDRDRDWGTLMKAFANDPAYDVRIATRRKVAQQDKPSNVTITNVNGLPAQREFYDWADVIVVPLHPNYHASGITVMLEAVAMGKPVVATAGGGLEDYFSAKSAWYVPVHSPDAIRRVVDSLAEAPEETLAQAVRAQRELAEKDLTTQGFAKQHVTLTDVLIDGAARREEMMAGA
ncbi:glycosyltransferase [Paraburkholderia sp.]|uniref:glycosyltransferase n=1 Tax=Paraburkholderia sp. TaxID=1926495 RepID=UPI00238B3BB8|nr:glycosyltransferase [Paraburkholderia sp.]MDE1184668.1 glycosyltransferase [Paraburkholderia sp.]